MILPGMLHISLV
jgi:triosephosphate isomerase